MKIIKSLTLAITISLLFLISACVSSSGSSSNQNSPSDITLDGSNGGVTSGQTNVSLTPIFNVKFPYSVSANTFNSLSVVVTTDASLLNSTTLKQSNSNLEITNVVANNNNTLFTFSLNNKLSEKQKYYLKLTDQIRYLNGNSIKPTIFNFTTGDLTIPVVSLIQPTSGSTNASGDKAIQALFSEPVQGVDTNSFKLFDQLGSPIVSSVAADSTPNVFNFVIPVGGLNDGAYSVTFTNQIIDFSNNPLAPTVFSFVVKQLTYSLQVGTTGGQTYGNGISTDSSGNVYVTGYTNKGISGQTQQGVNDYFLAKYASNGNLIFTRQVGATGGQTYGTGISTDSSGNVYVTGTTDVGISGQTQQGYIDYFLAKYNSSGTLLFTRQVGATSGETYGRGIYTDSSGNVYITGDTSKGISGQTQHGDFDYFLAKYDSSGNLLFTRQVGATGGETYGRGISPDSSGNVYVTGYTNTGISGQTQQGLIDYLLAKYDINGNLLFTRQVGTTGGNTTGRGISTDNSGNVYVTGTTTRSISGQTQQGLSDYFLAKYDNNGNFLFTRQVGATGGNTFGSGISTDSSGNVYVTGETNVGISGQTQQGLNDYFLAKYASNGNLLFTRQVGATGGNTTGRGISHDSSGNVYVIGNTNTGISGQTQQGLYDYFLAKYQQ